MQKKIIWIDNLKAICIFLVVYGHFATLNTEVKSLIYSFHLPAFLLITGYLNFNSLQKPNGLSLIKNQLFYFLLLYALFSIASSVLWYLLEARHLPVSEIIKPLSGSLLGLHGPELKLIHNNDPLWYFPFLITSLLFAFLFVKSGLPLGYLIIISAVIAYGTSYFPPMIWSLDLAPLGAFFILVGAGFRNFENTHGTYYTSQLIHGNSRRESSVFDSFKATGFPSGMTKYFFIMCIWLFLVWLNGRINMNSRDWGNSWVLFILAALAGSYFLMCICQRIPASKLAAGLSQHTLIIFCTHIYFVKALNNPLSNLPDDIRGLAIFAAAMVITLVCWCISLVVQPLLVHWLKPKPSAEFMLSKRS